MIRPLALLALCSSIAVLVGCRGGVGDLCESERDCRGELDCTFVALASNGPKIDAGGSRCTGAPCQGGEGCDSETEFCHSVYGCLNSCERDDDCPASLACLEGKCVVTCQESADCLTGTCPEPGGFCVRELP